MNREQLLAAMGTVAAEKPRLVSIKGLGDVHIREITVGEIDDQLADTADKKDKRRVARGACRLLSDEDGNMLLDPDNASDVALMAKQPLRVLQEINKAADLDPGNSASVNS